VTRWRLIETIAIIGSPASRGAVSSVGGAGGRACFGAASAVSAVVEAIAASTAIANGRQRRTGKGGCAVENRFIMPCPIEMPVRACVDQVSDREFWVN